MQEKTFFMIKPDGVKRGLEKEIFTRLEKAGLKINFSQNLLMTKDLAEQLYAPHLGKEFYPGLIRFIASGPVAACIVSGEEAVAKVREIMGATDPRMAAPGTIRGELKEAEVINKDGIIKNLVHGSDSLESAARELAIFFQ